MSEFEELPYDGESNEKITLYFLSTIGPGKQEKLEVARGAPVEDIKYTISQIFGLPINEFHLVYNGLTLDPDDVLDNYDPVDGETILLIPVSTAG